MSVRRNMNNIIKIEYYKSPYGEIIIGEYNSKLCLCDWRYRKMRNSIDKRIKAKLNAEYEIGESTIAQLCISQLKEYFSCERKEFDIPLEFAGTKFQAAVWDLLTTIPYGTTATYMDLSKSLGNADAVRAVASANGANAISIIVPCHRIIGSDGKMVGYVGGTAEKKKLLELEGAIKKTQLSLFE